MRQHPVAAVQDLAVHVERGLEVRGVGDGDLDEDHVGPRRAGRGRARIWRDLVAGTRSRSRASGSLATSRIVAAGAVAHEQLGRGVERDVGGPQLERRGASRETSETAMIAGDEAGADLHAVRALDDVVDGGVDEHHARSRANADGPAGAARPRRAASVTATAAEVISTRTPVA